MCLEPSMQLARTVPHSRPSTARGSRPPVKVPGPCQRASSVGKVAPPLPRHAPSRRSRRRSPERTAQTR
eukprot:5485827-Lingulodinium_polyedra.AAC.1